MCGWEGTVSQLVGELSRIVRDESWAGPSPNVRLIRKYTQLGVVDRPVRRGREAYYDFRHLSQFMATRWMLQDGWLLAKIAEVTATRSTPDLLSIIPEAPSNAAL